VVKVVGLGARDTLREAQAFRERHGTASFTMLWDESLASWRQMEVTNQPAAILFDRHGQILDRWAGMFDEAEVLDLARRT